MKGIMTLRFVLDLARHPRSTVRKEAVQSLGTLAKRGRAALHGCCEAFGSPCSQPDSTKARERQALVRVFGFGCSAGTVGTDMAGVVVAVGETTT